MRTNDITLLASITNKGANIMISNMLRFPLSMLDDEMERWFYPEGAQIRSRRAHSTYPPINVGSTDKSVEVYLFTPGMEQMHWMW